MTASAVVTASAEASRRYPMRHDPDDDDHNYEAAGLRAAFMAGAAWMEDTMSKTTDRQDGGA